MEREAYRNFLIDKAASAYSHGRMGEAEFESFASLVQGAWDEAALRAAAADLSAALPGDASILAGEAAVEAAAGTAHAGTAVADSRDLSINMSTLKKRGDWVDARRYRLFGKMSTIELDYREYAEAENFRMTLDVDLSMSTLRIRVPSDWQVDCRLSTNSASTVADRGPFPTRGANLITIEGAASMSTIKVKRVRRGGRRGLFFLLFGDRRLP